MTLTSFSALMDGARHGSYAVGYFESWDLQSLLAVADAAEATHSPVLLGFSGIYLTHPARVVNDPLAAYAAMGLAVCERISVPACLIYNESPDAESVVEAARLGFGLVMYSADDATPDKVQRITGEAHTLGAAVEGEPEALPGVAGDLPAPPDTVSRTTPQQAAAFVQQTDVDALAVNLGQMHLHGKHTVRLDLELLSKIRAAVDVPLVLHGATSVEREDLHAAAQAGIQKINLGSHLKQVYFAALGKAVNAVGPEYNPYEVVGSGMAADVLNQARLAMQAAVEDFMKLFGSAGQA